MDSKIIPREKFDEVVNLHHVDLVTLTNSLGTVVQITNYGARIVTFLVKDALGEVRDIVLGHDRIESYINSSERYFNAAIGRYANRIDNGKITIDGKEYQLSRNSGSNCLHGGFKGLNETIWEIAGTKKNKVKMRCELEDGSDGFPGNLEVEMKYILTDENELVMEYYAKSDKDTVINLTNHAFFNLGTSHENTVLNHRLLVDATLYTPVDSNMIPTGEERPVKDTVFDFSIYKDLGKDISSDILKPTKGYDHNFILDNYPSRNGAPVFAASLICSETRLKLEVSTTEPGLQVYTGNFLNNKDTGKGGVKYKPHCAVCLETQHYPDSPNKPDFPSTLLKEGEEFFSSTVYKVSTYVPE
jgi:aldose 1-epimerase